MSARGYNTNLAAEFYVLSTLYRLGVAANLTLGNRKSVDIVVAGDVGEVTTIDVKGLAGNTAWPADNVKDFRPNHFPVFVCYRGRIADPTVPPEVYVVPSQELVYHAPGGRKVIRLSTLRREGTRYRDAWHLLTGT